MILLDTNVVIYAFDRDSPFCEWAREIISDAVSQDGAAINAVVLAELCVGDTSPKTLADRILHWGITILDLPAAASVECAAAYAQYRERRMKSTERPEPMTPLPDFFIGAHAKLMGWDLATADKGRFETYFPGISLKTPH